METGWAKPYGRLSNGTGAFPAWGDKEEGDKFKPPRRENAVASERLRRNGEDVDGEPNR